MSNSKTHAIVLAGGQGTRLRERVADRPKPMAEVQGRPFLEYILLNLKKAGVENVVLSVCHQYELIVRHFGSSWQGMNISYAIEKEPLGTGGAIRLSLEQCPSDQILILNGDSILDLDIFHMVEQHEALHSSMTLALVKVPEVSRYGAVTLVDGKIVEFKEKQTSQGGEGLINSGIYLAKKDFLMKRIAPGKSSFEKDVIPYLLNGDLSGFPVEGFFIDIGIPADFDRAQQEVFFRELASQIRS